VKWIILAALAAWPVGAVELATGKMLGPQYKARSFYTKTGKGAWRETYTGKEFRPAAAGKLMNLRVAQAITHDEWLKEEPFDPEANTRRVIAALDDYRQHGILAISVSLQGANPAYERTPNIKRIRHYNLGPEKGSHNSAFRPDGSLKDAWMKRALMLARALDDWGMIFNPVLFYAYQDELLEGPAAIERGIRNVADWLIDNNVRNVLVEMANEYDSKPWDHDGYMKANMGKLVETLRARFSERKAGWRPAIGSSTLGGKTMRLYDDMRSAADLVMVHANHASPAEKAARVKALMADAGAPGPVYFNEDDNGRESTQEHLKLELDSCDAIFDNGGSWGYMPWIQLQIWPFHSYRPGPNATVRDDMPEKQRDLAYFKAVLEHMRKKIYR
jgi:hypothetical protein